MGLGMIGAIGGAGQGLQGQAAVMRADILAGENEARDTKRAQFLAQLREEYAIKGEERAETRAIASESRQDWREQAREDRGEQRGYRASDRQWEKDKERHPEKVGMVVSEATAKAKGALDFESANITGLAGNKQVMTDAGVSGADKSLKKAQTVNTYADAEYKSGAQTEETLSRTRFNDGARTAAAEAKAEGGGGGGGADKITQAELKSMGDEARAGRKSIDDAKLNGTWTGTPEQKAVESRVASKELQYRDRLKSLNGGGGATADPLNMRGKSGSEGGSLPSPNQRMSHNDATGTKAPRDWTANTGPGADMREPFAQELRALRAQEQTEKDPAALARIRGDIKGTLRTAKASGLDMEGGMVNTSASVPPPAAAVPAPAVAAPVVLRPDAENPTAEIAAVQKEMDGLTMPTIGQTMARPQETRAYIQRMSNLRTRLRQLEDQKKGREQGGARPR